MKRSWVLRARKPRLAPVPRLAARFGLFEPCSACVGGVPGASRPFQPHPTGLFSVGAERGRSTDKETRQGARRDAPARRFHPPNSRRVAPVMPRRTLLRRPEQTPQCKGERSESESGRFRRNRSQSTHSTTASKTGGFLAVYSLISGVTVAKHDPDFRRWALEPSRRTIHREGRGMARH